MSYHALNTLFLKVEKIDDLEELDTVRNACENLAFTIAQGMRSLGETIRFINIVEPKDPLATSLDRDDVANLGYLIAHLSAFWELLGEKARDVEYMAKKVREAAEPAPVE